MKKTRGWLSGARSVMYNFHGRTVVDNVCGVTKKLKKTASLNFVVSLGYEESITICMGD